MLYGLGALLGSLCGLLSYGVARYLRPPKKPLEEPVRVEGWVPVGYTREVPPGGTKAFAYGRVPGVVINEAGDFRAFSALCSHFACAVRWVPEKEVFSCPCHGGSFDTRGKAVGGPPEEPLKSFEVQVRGDRIYVKAAWLT